MTKMELICGSITMCICLIVATISLSDRISEREFEHRTLKTAIAFILSVYSSFGIATYVEYYCLPDFKLWQFLLIGFSIFGAYFGVSFAIGLYKIRKDEKERERCRKKYDDLNAIDNMKKIIIFPEEYSSCIETRNDIAERDNCMVVNGNCRKIISIEEARKRKEDRK